MLVGATSFGDFGAVYSGTRVFGNDLGGGNFNGLYQADKRNHLESPEIDVSGHTAVRLQYRRWLNIEDGDFDQAAISADGVKLWSNRATGGMGETHHTDKEWRFHDVDVSAAAADGTLKIRFELTSDGGLEMGGWNVDDFCLVAYTAAVCGDGQLTGGEACDDGNTESGDGCSATCGAEAGDFCGNGTVEGAEACDDGNAVDGDACRNDCSGAGPGGGGGGGAAEAPGACACRAAGRAAPPLAALPLLLLGGLGLVAVHRRRRRA